MKKLFGFAALFAALASGLAFVGCSCGNDVLPVVIVVPGDSSTGGGTTTPTTTDTGNGGGQTQSGTDNGSGTSPASTTESNGYTIKVSSGIENGTVTVDKTSAAFGETVSVTVTPTSCYELSIFTVITENKKTVEMHKTENTWTFRMPAHNVTVFAGFAAENGDYTKIRTVEIDSDICCRLYDIVSFGLWPQTAKANDVVVDEDNCETEDHGYFTYYKGSDGKWYVKLSKSEWFKVEPIKWRVLTTNYKGNKLLLAENILIGGIPFSVRKEGWQVNGQTVYPYDYSYSTIRSFLTGSDGEYKDKGFLQTAFTSGQQAAIGGTTDKIFLLGNLQVTTYTYGFVNADTRIRITTDFAKCSGAPQSLVEGYGGTWLLSSKAENGGIECVSYSGGIDKVSVNGKDCGVVPALCLPN